MRLRHSTSTCDATADDESGLGPVRGRRQEPTAAVPDERVRPSPRVGGRRDAASGRFGGRLVACLRPRTVSGGGAPADDAVVAGHCAFIIQLAMAADELDLDVLRACGLTLPSLSSEWWHLENRATVLVAASDGELAGYRVGLPDWGILEPSPDRHRLLQPGRWLASTSQLSRIQRRPELRLVVIHVAGSEEGLIAPDVVGKFEPAATDSLPILCDVGDDSTAQSHTTTRIRLDRHIAAGWSRVEDRGESLPPSVRTPINDDIHDADHPADRRVVKALLRSHSISRRLCRREIPRAVTTLASSPLADAPQAGTARDQPSAPGGPVSPLMPADSGLGGLGCNPESSAPVESVPNPLTQKGERS